MHKECGIGKYGIKCFETCGNCRNQSQCNNVNGSCSEGCSAGYKGSFCTECKCICNFLKFFFFNIISDNSCILIWLIIYWMCFCFVLCLFLFFAFPLKSQIACKCTYFSYCILYTCIWLKEPRCIEVTHYYRTTTLFQNLQKKRQIHSV